MASILNPLSSSLDARKQTGALAVVVVTGAKAAMLLGLPLCIGFILLGSRFIYIWMGAEYAGPAGVVLAVLSVGHLIGLPYYTISGVLYGLGRHRVVAMSRIFEGVVNVALSIALITRYGLVGVALGTIIPHIIVVAGILPSSLPRWMPLNLREYYISTYVRPFLAAVPFVAVCWYIAHVVVPAGFLTFFACMTAAMPSYLVPVWFIALTPAERAAAREYVGQRFGGRRAAEATS